jgi:hypothetical protein
VTTCANVQVALTPTVSANPVPSLKKNCWEFYRHVFHNLRWAITAPDGFPREENLSNSRDTQLHSNGENGRPLTTSHRDTQLHSNGENGRPLTTSHVFWPNERRKAAFWLPIWLPISDFLAGKCTPEIQRAPGGVSRAERGKSASTEKRTRNFYTKGSPQQP